MTEPAPPRGLGPRLLACRERANLTQEAVAQVAGVHQTYISDLERGIRRRVSAEVLRKLADLFDVSLDYLMDRTDKESMDPDTVGTESIKVWVPLLPVP